MTEEALLTQYYAGDDTAFEALMAIYRPQLNRYFLQCTGDPATAEDLTQEVQCNVVKTKGNPKSMWRNEKPVHHWVFSIARNTFLGSSRKQWQESEKTRRLEQSSNVNEPIDRDALIALEQCLPKLSERQRTVVEWRLKGFSQTEIAQEMRLSDATISDIAKKALEELRNLLDLPDLSNSDSTGEVK